MALTSCTAELSCSTALSSCCMLVNCCSMALELAVMAWLVSWQKVPNWLSATYFPSSRFSTRCSSTAVTWALFRIRDFSRVSSCCWVAGAAWTTVSVPVRPSRASKAYCSWAVRLHR